MGGAAKAVGSAVKSVTKGVSSVVKGVASGVKKVATGVVSGIGKVVGGVVKGVDKLTGGAFGKIMGKLGPIGTIGLGLLLPGAGAFLGGLWTSAAGAASAYAGVGSGIINAVGAGMQWAAQAAGAIGTGIGKVTGGITNAIKSGLSHIGGNVMNGAEYLFRGAQEFVGVKNPTSIRDIGAWVGEKAQSLNPFKGQSQLPAQEGMFSSVETGFGAQNVAMSPVTPEMMGNYDMVTPMFSPSGESLGNALASPSPWAATRESALNQSFINPSLGAFQTGTGSLAGGQSSIAGNTYLSPGGVTQGSLTAPPVGVNVSGAAKSSVGGKPSFFDAALRAGTTMLSNIGQQPGMMPQPYFAGNAGAGDDFASQRFGVGGQGSSGGDFLSEQQRQQQLLLAQQLAQLG